MDPTERADELVFVHDAATAVDSSRAATFVALTPAAYEDLDHRGAHPRVLDDLAERPAFLLDVTEYYRWKHDWIRRLDRTARGGDGIALVAAQLLQTPIDSVVAAAVLLRSAIVRHAPAAVAYAGPAAVTRASIWHAGHLQFHPLLGDPPLAASLLPLIAGDLSLPYQTEDRAPVAEQPGPSWRHRLRTGLAQRLGPLRGRRPQLRRIGESGTLLLWYSGYGIESFEREQHAAGH